MNEKCRELIFLALGKASMCWVPDTGNLVFNSTRCGKIGNDLIVDLDREIKDELANMRPDKEHVGGPVDQD